MSIIIRNKYIMMYMPEHRLSDSTGYVYEHRIEAEKMLGRHLKHSEVVHHIDENKTNNSQDNLMVFKTNGDHTAFHKGCEICKDGDVYVAIKKEKYFCPECGQEKDYKAKLCLKCSLKKKRINIPPKEELENILGTMSFVAIGKKYGVTDNAVRKWCKKYDLPYRTSDITMNT